MKYIYGPVPSRRLGLSLGVSPIPKKTCNYSCIYCQLGRTDHMTKQREMFFPVKDIIAELDRVLKDDIRFDVVTIVGEGEPTLYLGLGELITDIQTRIEMPVAVITNGALLYDTQVRSELFDADIVLPTFDAFDQASFKKINRPHRSLDYEMVKQGLINFSREYQGQLWLELMLMSEINDDLESLQKYAAALNEIKYDRLYLNTPVRPPAEAYVRAVSHEIMNQAVEMLGGISIELLLSLGFHSDIQDDYEAVLSIIKRHPMNQYEIRDFLIARGNRQYDLLLDRLRTDPAVFAIHYKGYETYRLK